MKRQFLSLLALALMMASYNASAATWFNRLIWDHDPAHSAVIGFSPNGTSTNPYVRYGLDTNESNWTDISPTADHTFQLALKSYFVRLTGLPENSPVYYRVCDQDGCGQRFWFQTAPTDNSPFVVVAGGDTRTGWGNRRQGNILISKIRPLFIMHGGDYTNLNTFADMGTFLGDWELTFTEETIDGQNYKRIYPLVPTHGNHEDGDYKTLCKVFGVDFNQDGECNNYDTYGAFDISPLLRVYTLNSQYQNSGWSSHAAAMNSWLADDIESEGAAVSWRFAQYHKPMFPHYSGKSDNTELYNWWSEVFYNHGMNLVVESDTHINKLTHAVKPSADGYEAVTDGGTVFVGEGSWGAPSRSANQPKDWTIDLASIQQFKVIQVSQDELVLGTAQFDGEVVGLTREQRSADTSVLPEGINWWLANEVGNKVILSRADNNLSVIENAGSTGTEDKFISLALTDDTFIARSKADENFNGSEDGLLIDNTDLSLGEMVTLLKFDLNNMPTCINTNAASLVINVTDVGGTYGVYSANSDWDEETATWSSVGDITGDLIAETSGAKKDTVEISLAGTDIIQKWLVDGNYGLVLKTDSFNGVDFDSKETGNGARLKLSYDESETCEGSGSIEVANNTLPNKTFQNDGEEKIVLSFVLTSDTENAQLEKLSLSADGDIDETKISQVNLYIDADKDGVADAGELVAQSAYSADNGSLDFTLDTPYQMPVGDVHLLVGYQF
ncbi:MAG: DNRLRE domain-containing protein [Pseudomonadales bacterium]|nr:DNRLRE domain-containing protein [Pseudomonadales bacterium]